MPASSLFPLYHATRARCQVPLAGVPLHPVLSIIQGLSRAVHTPLALGVFMLHFDKGEDGGYFKRKGILLQERPFCILERFAELPY